MNYSEVYYFWKYNKKFWITIENKDEVDKIIFQKFYSIQFKDQLDSKENFIGYIIYLDQFQRHFQRHLNIVNEQKILEDRIKAINLLQQKDNNFFQCLEDWELIFCLMPYKHLKNYDFCLEKINNWLSFNKLTNDFCKFFNDTYQKAFSYQKICEKIQTIHPIKLYDSNEICDYYPEEQIKLLQENVNLKLEKDEKYIVSLSGGVDSMVLLYLLKSLNFNVFAIHIIYGNRDVSKQEYSFVSTFCEKLNVKLFSYTIQYLKRDKSDREFYEKMTRDIRFMVYKCVIEKIDGGSILLGHIKEDLVENVWTNFARGQHLDNLKKMEEVEIQQEICIKRPMLNWDKKRIIDLSNRYGIPYLKNTTPEWSNRGKFRNNFLKASQHQYGENVDDKVLQVADIFKKQNDIIKRFIYEPIIDSYDKDTKEINITKGIELELDIGGWVYIFEIMCHNKWNVKKPSIKSIESFCRRIQCNFEGDLRVQMKKDYQFVVFKENEKVKLKFLNIFK
jgi:tRNA(Ile)-lysidine synthetase-like protein